jgi:glycosyltransferase involved in cell wall biosynthesis
MTTELISVVIPCYNAKRYLAGALRSVLSQGWSSLEVIVVDDGSSDGSADLVAREFPEVVLLRQSNQGAAAARNLGIRHARGEWIAFLDSDDVWLPGKLKAQWQRIQAEPGARMVYTAWKEWESECAEPSGEDLASLIEGAGKETWGGPSGWIYPQLLLDCVVWTSTVMAQRSLLEEVGPFDPELRLGQDYDLWLRASRLTPILRVHKPYALYRIHPANSTKRVPKLNYRGIVLERALTRWGLVGPDGSRADFNAVRRGLARSWSDFAWAQLQAGNLEQARKAGRHAARLDWRHLRGWKMLAQASLRSFYDGAG